MEESFQIFEDLIEEEGLACSVKLEGRTKATFIRVCVKFFVCLFI